MPSLADTLASIPGYGAYVARRQMNEQQPMRELQQAGAALSLQKIIEAKQLQGTIAQAGGNPQRTIDALLASGHPKAIELATRMKAAFAEQKGQPIGSGGLLMPGGAVIPPAARPGSDEGTWSEPFQLGGATVQKNSRTGQIRTAVTREPQVRVTQQAPVTPVTIQDPNDPSSTIIIDGRTRRVLGKGPKLTEAGKIDAKTALQMTGLGLDLQTAEDLLMGVTRTSDGQIVKGNLPTGSGVGSIYDAAAGFVGLSPSGAAEADSLKTVAARLVGRIPRFEGPQSDKDVKLYQQAAGDAGNEKLPRGRRIAAIKTMKVIYEGYESGRRGRLIGDRRISSASPTTSGVKVVDW